MVNPHFSQGFCCCGAARHVYSVALPRAPRRTVEYACGALGRAPCIHARLRRLATKPCEKCGLSLLRDSPNKKQTQRAQMNLFLSSARMFAANEYGICEMRG
jgi:hypothetical protein